MHRRTEGRDSGTPGKENEREGSTAGGGVQIIAELESQEKYAGYLENGTKKMAARPFVDKIKEKATPEIEKIYKEPYG